MKSALQPIAIGLGLGLAGMTIGWYAAHQQHDHDDDVSAAAEDDDGELHLEPETLLNLGVRFETIQTGTFERCHDLPAVVVEGPGAFHAVTSPFPGVVATIHVEPGTLVAAGAPLVTILRDAITLPEWKRTADILAPLAERLHEGVAALRLAKADITILSRELERVQGLTGEGETLPLLPRQRLVELENQILRARQVLENTRSELERHGIGQKEMLSIEEGMLPSHSPQLWRRVLEHNGLWTGPAKALFEALPATEQERHGATALIGELVAAGLATHSLAEQVQQTPALSAHFGQTCSLLLAGHSLERVVQWAREGAFEARVVIRAPEGAEDFDVANLRIQPGAQVAAGQTLLLLHDARTPLLRVEAAGSDVSVLLHALSDKVKATASPWIAGSGPELTDLQIQRISADLESDSHSQTGMTIGWLKVANLPVDTGEGPRSWQLRSGLRYRVRIPVERTTDVFVLPRDAVAQVGPDMVVFVSHGDHLHPEPVHVLVLDREQVVLAPSDHLKPGTMIAVTGAFALAQAMQKDAGGGHHHHDH